MNILISGATGDIGLALCKRLKHKHRLIILGYKNVERLQELRQDLGEACIYASSLDLSKEESALKLFSKGSLDGQDIDAFIHLAGKSYFGLVQDMKVGSWENILATNLNSAFYITKQILPQMISNKFGKLLFISSIWGQVGASTEVAYSVSKSGLDGFAKALSKEVAPSNISVNSLDLGMIDTKMNDTLSPEDKKSIEEDIPMGRQASTDECAEFIEKILQMPQYFTGQNIGFDGGWK